MTTTKQGDAAPDANESSDSGPSDAYKALQRELEKSRARHRELTRNLVEAEDTRATASRIEALVIQLTEASSGELAEKAKAARATDLKQSEYRRTLMNLLYEHNAEEDWDAERLKDVRETWGKGDFAGAVAQARKVLEQTSTSSADIKKQVEEAVAARLRELNISVDKGGSTATGEKRITRANLQDRLNPNLSGRALKEASDTLLDQLYAKSKR